jgi:hypothetical protein
MLCLMANFTDICVEYRVMSQVLFAVLLPLRELEYSQHVQYISHLEIQK